MVDFEVTNRADRRCAALADRHYPRRKRGARQFVAPGTPLVLYRPGIVWVSLIQAHQDHDYKGAWLCSMFRNETSERSSALIVECVARTIAEWGPLPTPHRMITFVDPTATAARRSRRAEPGHCFRMAGWREIARTKGGHGRPSLVVLQCPESEKIGEGS